MAKRRLKNPKEAATLRSELLKKQGGIDPITKEVIRKPVLDHFHEGNQHCRQVLQNEVNAWEGKVVNSFHRYMKHLTDKPLPEILRNLADYLETNNNIPEDEQIIHHTALSKEVSKFKGLTSSTQCKLLEEHGIVPESNTTKRAKQARVLIKNGTLNMTPIKKGS